MWQDMYFVTIHYHVWSADYGIPHLTGDSYPGAFAVRCRLRHRPYGP